MENDHEFSPEYRILAVQARSDISEEAEGMFETLKDRGMIIVRCDKGEEIADALTKSGLSPDIRIQSDDEPDSKVYFNHRQTEDADIYFVYNHSGKPYSAPLSLRTERTDIEFWNPLSGEREGNTDNILQLAPYASTILIAR